MARILTGIQSSGIPHLGNLLGAIIPAIELSKDPKNESLFFIADMHSLTTIRDAELLKENTYATAAAWLAFGFNTNDNIFYRQSDIPEVCELMWYLNCLTPYPMLANAHSFKDKASKLHNVNAGLFTYPVLMAADILLYDAEIVPVGKDQKQHLEMAQDMATRFNNTFGDVFVVPEPDIDKEKQLVPGIDGQKMSKSHGNTIPVFCNEKTLKKKVMSIVTDSTPIDEPKSTDSPIFQIYSLFLDKKEKKELINRFKTPGLKYGDVKKEIFDRIWTHFEPFRNKRNYLTNHSDYVKNILKEGAQKASAVGDDYLSRAREAMGLNY